MSILIKGMEMPKNCTECPCYNDELDICNITSQPTTIEDWHKLKADCPLIEVPKHGLIDKQMLLRNIADNQFAHSSVGHEEDYAFWGKVWVYIFDAPTIIEKVFYRDKGDNSVCREPREAEGEDDNTE